MNELAEKRNTKIYNIVLEHPSGIFDTQIAEIVKWDVSTVRSTCGALRKRGKILIKEVIRDDKQQWFIMADDDSDNEDISEYELKRVTERLGKAISEFLYVILKK